MVAMAEDTMAEDTMAMERGLLMPNPQLLLMPLLMLMLGTVPMAMALDTMAMAMLPGHTMVDMAMVDTAVSGARRRGLLMPSLQLLLRPLLMLMLGMVPMVMAVDTMAATMPAHTMADTMVDTGEDTMAMERGLLMPNPQLLLMPLLTLMLGTVPMAMAADTMAMVFGHYG